MSLPTTDGVPSSCTTPKPTPVPHYGLPELAVRQLPVTYITEKDVEPPKNDWWFKIAILTTAGIIFFACHRLIEHTCGVL